MKDIIQSLQGSSVVNINLKDRLNSLWNSIPNRVKIAALALTVAGLSTIAGEQIGERVGYGKGFSNAETRVNRFYELHHGFGGPSGNYEKPTMNYLAGYDALVHSKTPDAYYLSPKWAEELVKIGQMSQQEYEKYRSGK